MKELKKKIMTQNLLDHLEHKQKLGSRKIFPISNKHKEGFHKGEDHTAVDHTCEECSYRTNLKANYLKHMFNTHTP